MGVAARMSETIHVLHVRVPIHESVCRSVCSSILATTALWQILYPYPELEIDQKQEGAARKHEEAAREQ
jgi:hypothetical protein